MLPRGLIYFAQTLGKIKPFYRTAKRWEMKDGVPRTLYH